MLARGERVLDALFGVAGEPVDYRRRGAPIATGVPAKLGTTAFRFTNPDGTSIRVDSRDFIVRRKDVPVEPQEGDEIVWNGRAFLVAAPNGEPCWGWHGRHLHSMLRIHTLHDGKATG
jgi:hypothetical protein